MKLVTTNKTVVVVDRIEITEQQLRLFQLVLGDIVPNNFHSAYRIELTKIGLKNIDSFGGVVSETYDEIKHILNKIDECKK